MTCDMSKECLDDMKICQIGLYSPFFHQISSYSIDTVQLRRQSFRERLYIISVVSRIPADDVCGRPANLILINLVSDCKFGTCAHSHNLTKYRIQLDTSAHIHCVLRKKVVMYKCITFNQVAVTRNSTDDPQTIKNRLNKYSPCIGQFVMFTRVFIAKNSLSYINLLNQAIHLLNI